MKSLVPTLAIFASSALAAKYAAGDLCHSNVECNKNCLDAQFTVAEQDGGYVFVCDPKVADATQWYGMRCIYTDFSRAFPIQTIDKDVTASACKTVGGQVCGPSCVLSGKRSVDGETRSKWKQACGNDSADIDVRPDEQAAKVLC
jgi:hypothetical protein